MKIKKFLSDLRIQTKLFLAITSITILTIIFIIPGVIRVAKRSLIYQIDTNQKMSLAHTKNLINGHFTELNYKIAFVKKLEIKNLSSGMVLKIILEEIQKSSEFIAIAVFDKGNKLVEKVSVTDFEIDTEKIIKDELYQKVSKDREVQVSGIKYIKQTPVVEIFYPVINFNCVYILADLTKLSKDISEEEKLSQSKIFLVNKNGEVIFSTIPELVGKRYTKFETIRNNLLGRVPSNRPHLAKILSFNNQEVVIKLDKLQLNEEYYIMIEKYVKMVTGPINFMTSFVLGWMAVAIGLAFIISLVISSYMIRPITRLVGGMKNLSMGKFTSIEVESNDEIGFLANSFNQTVSEIKNLQKRLVESERLATIGQMASMLGHEIRNPLSVIYMSSSLLVTRLQDLDIKKFAQIIKQETATINKIAEDLLSYSRTRPPHKEEVNLEKVFDEIVMNLRIPPNVVVEKKIEPDSIIMAERIEIYQLLMNLIDNALGAILNSKKGDKVTVEITKIPNDKIKISVIDNGPGIPEDILKKIFEPLFSTKPQGTGLGLAVVKRVIERHNGNIEVNSEVGSGTRFDIILPVR